jgi:flavin-dependent dehydrogenase
VKTCDALVVGGGPAGSACARVLHEAGADVVVADRVRFPRDKPCAGWITPEVVRTLDLDLDDYRRRHVLQAFTGFSTCRLGDPPIDTDYGRVVSYGIRRCEFDTYLLERSGARLEVGRSVTRIERDGAAWVVNDEIRAGLIVGAGGHFCPVARRLNPTLPARAVVAAQEVEFGLTPEQAGRCPVLPERPRLYFCRDLVGYGWVVRKGRYLNVGLGRLDRHVASHARAFLDFVVARGDVPPDMPVRWPGHAYLVFTFAPRRLVDAGVVLIGDAAGLAYPESGEGIGPAVDSGVLAARTILAAGGRYTAERLAPYAEELRRRRAAPPWRRALGALVPRPLRPGLAGWFLGSAWLTRHVVLDSWFLHSNRHPAARSATALPGA